MYLAKTEIYHFVHIFIFIILLFFHRHNSLQKQSLGIKSSKVCQVNKWSCLQVIFDLVFEQQQLKPGHVSFVQTPFNAAKQLVMGCALLSFARKEQGLLNEFM